MLGQSGRNSLSGEFEIFVQGWKPETGQRVNGKRLKGGKYAGTSPLSTFPRFKSDRPLPRDFETQIRDPDL